ncbi:MAG: 2-isopropylmalate synthase [Candidatus Rokuibacteriota bacterium]|nr:MAG: 2-isopropylmalate synthase [Candidatus Rokubacteria bacterium]
MDRVIVFDTTLRDGEQAPGFSMNTMEKLEMARQLARHLELLHRVHGEAGRLLAVPQCGIEAVDAVRHARGYCEDVEFSPEDASRSDFDYMCDVLSATIEAGAGIINIPDTVGYAIPREWGERIARIREKVHGLDRVVLSVHCHNDLGQAVANSLTAIMHGARQVECTINGIGERAGKIFKTSRLLSHITGVHVQPNKAVVGENAFAHEAGIHQDGVLKEKLTYEIMRPEDIGRPANKLVLGKHSGRAALSARLKELGFALAGGELDRAFKAFKDLADRKKEVYDEDLMAIVTDEATQPVAPLYELDYLHVISGTGVVPSATVRLKKEGQTFQDSGVGDGPIDAVLAAIEAITGVKGRLQDYALRSATWGKDAIGEVSMKIDFDGTLVSGRGASTDVIEASARAYLSALNRVARASAQRMKEVGP